MLIQNIFTIFFSKPSLSGADSELIALLCFGIGMFLLTVGLRALFNLREKAVKRFFRVVNDSVVMSEN